MKLSFEYKGTKINYDLMYKKTTAISINVGVDGQVSVTAPVGTSVETVRDKVKGNAPWIISELDKYYQKTNESSLLNQYTYLGKNYRVEIIQKEDTDKITVKLVRGKFVIETYTDNPKRIREALLKWYKDKVTMKIGERLKIYAKYFKYLPTEIIVGDNGESLLEIKNNKLFVKSIVGVLPLHIMDYIVTSVLCNLNYSTKYQENIKKLKEILPEYETDKAWLDRNKEKLLL